MEYLPPFNVIKRDLRLLAIQGVVRVNITYDEFLAVLRRLLPSTIVDEVWYRATYPDVADAITAGVYQSAQEHFIQHGYVEGRIPHNISVHEEWYLSTYPDVAEAIERGAVKSAKDHFIYHGYQEGRLPAGKSPASSRNEPSVDPAARRRTPFRIGSQT
jgi:hypothetical protein